VPSLPPSRAAFVPLAPAAATLRGARLGSGQPLGIGRSCDRGLVWGAFVFFFTVRGSRVAGRPVYFRDNHCSRDGSDTLAIGSVIFAAIERRFALFTYIRIMAFTSSHFPILLKR